MKPSVGRIVHYTNVGGGSPEIGARMNTPVLQVSGQVAIEIGDAVATLYPIAGVDLHLSVEDDRVVVRSTRGVGRVVIDEPQKAGS